MEFNAKRILVLGLGESGLAMSRWLLRQGARVRVADSRTTPPNVDTLRALAADASDIEIISGPFQDSLLDGVDMLAISPGISTQIPIIDSASARHIPVISEIDLFAAGIRTVTPDAKLIAVTGSNGKTTTVSLTAHLLNASGIPAIACGNISPSALDALMSVMDASPGFTSKPEVWVLELSSFQLETTNWLQADAATLLNISEDHLDRHGDLSTYAQIKARIFGEKTVRVLNRDDDFSMSCQHEPARTITFGLSPTVAENQYALNKGNLMRGQDVLLAQARLSIAGEHNAANALAALALCEAIGISPDRLLPALTSFSGLPHRVEFVARINDVTYFDDSKGTNVGATLAAIRGLGCKVALILGGEGKDQDFSLLKDALSAHACAVALIGRDAQLIAGMIGGIDVPMHFATDLPEAVFWCAEHVHAGEAVLLSPACASFDMFKNYAHRAEVFIDAVHALERGRA